MPDASVIVEVLLGSPTGQAVADRLLGEDLFAPELLDAEVASAIRRSVLRSEMSEQEALERLALLARWPIERVGHRQILEGSVWWWRNVSAYDALYLAVATARDAHVLTVDGRLSRARATGVRVENVRVT